METAQLCLWETTVTASGANKAMVARRPVVAAMITTEQARKALRSTAGDISAWQIYRWVADGTLVASRPGAVSGAAKRRKDGRAANLKLRICSASVARLAQQLRDQAKTI